MIGGYMASLIMHVAVAKKVNKRLLKNEKQFLLGSLAPDLSKRFGVSRKKSHFSTTGFAPDMNLFLSKYKNYLKDAFVFGYYIHLLTDYYWENKFIAKHFNGKRVLLHNGKKFYCSYKKFMNYIYNDYDNLDLFIINKYGIDLTKLQGSKVDFIIKEIPVDKVCQFDFSSFNYKMYEKDKSLIISFDEACNFIDEVSDLILENLNLS